MTEPDDASSESAAPPMAATSAQPERPPRSYPRIVWHALQFWLLTLVLLVVFAAPLRLLRRALRRAGVEIESIRDISASSPILVVIALAEIAAVLLATRWMIRKDRMTPADVGLGRGYAGRDLLIGTLIGVVEFMLVPLFALMFGWVELAGAGGMAGLRSGALLSLATAVLALLPAAAFEEIADRGYVFSLLTSRSRVVAVALTSLLFTLMHATNAGFNAVAFAHVLLAGVALAVARLRSRALWVPIGWHFGWNMAQAWLFGCAVSGMRPAEPALFTLRFSGPALATGGAFGPESGLLALAASAITLSAYVMLVPARTPPGAGDQRTTISTPIAS